MEVPVSLIGTAAPDLYTADAAPESVLNFRKALRGADAYILAVPECTYEACAAAHSHVQRPFSSRG